MQSRLSLVKTQLKNAVAKHDVELDAWVQWLERRGLPTPMKPDPSRAATLWHIPQTTTLGIPVHVMAEAMANSFINDRAEEELINTACRQAIREHSRNIEQIKLQCNEALHGEYCSDADSGRILILMEEQAYRISLRTELEVALEEGIALGTSEDSLEVLLQYATRFDADAN